MLRHRALKQWNRIVSAHFPHLSLPQVTGLSLWSFGMVLTRSSSLNRVSEAIAYLNQERPNTVRQRLKEWYQEAAAKSGKHRSDWSVQECFAPLLAWVLELLPTDRQELFLAINSSSLKSRLTVLSVHVLYRDSAIPVAWKIMAAHQTGEWDPYWRQLFRALQGVVPQEWRVVVCADRGLYAEWLYQLIVEMGWQPFLRINHRPRKSVQLLPQAKWQPLAAVVAPGQQWQGAVRCFPSNPLECTLFARWDCDSAEPWLVLSDLTPTSGNVGWYGLRTWIEDSYRDSKSDGWRWQYSRITDPTRSERHWLAMLAMSVATLWALSLGTQVQDQQAASAKGTNPRPLRPPAIQPRSRPWSCFLLGVLMFPLMLIQGHSLGLPRLVPQFHLNSS